jgi:hypothetical protein
MAGKDSEFSDGTTEVKLSIAAEVGRLYHISCTVHRVYGNEGKLLMTDDGLVAIAAATVGEVVAMKLAPADHSIVLETLLRARLGGGTATPPVLAPAGGSGNGVATAPAEEGDSLGKLAVGLRLSRDTLELVYDFEDGVPSLVVSAKKIAPNKSTAVRQLGQLIAAARQIVGVEEWTSANVIRKVTQDYGRLDSSNFAASLQQMESVGVLRGKGSAREVKITKPGIESTTDLIKVIVGDA